MRPRNPLRLVARMLGFTEQPPRPKTTVREDVNNVGYYLMAGGPGADAHLSDKRVQREWDEYVSAL